MRIAGINNLSLNNGEGCRVVVFLQGCAHACPGCQNPDTWDFGGGYEVNVDELAADLLDIIEKHHLDGITLSGGDPMYQSDKVLGLLQKMSGVNVWCYTGFEWEEIKHLPCVQYMDAVVCGQFVEELKCEGKMYGSSNQYIVRRDKRTGEIEVTR